MKKYTILDFRKCLVIGIDQDVFAAVEIDTNDSRTMFFDFEDVGICHRHLISRGAKFVFIRYYFDHDTGRQRIQELLFCDDSFENIIEAEDFDFAIQKKLIKGVISGQTNFEF